MNETSNSGFLSSRMSLTEVDKNFLQTGLKSSSKNNENINRIVSIDESMKIRRKVDIHLLPLMMITYFIQFLDKSTIGNVAILGLQKSTHLTASQYNWLGTIFFISYLLFEYPQNLALQRIPVGKWIAFNAFGWAIFVSLQACCKNFIQLFVCRFFLGAFEGCATAGFMITTSMFYTHDEQGLRTGYWLLTSGFSVIVGSFVSYGVLHIGSPIMEPWQWFFIIIGLTTLFVAILLYFFFPDSPTSAWFLTPDERNKAVMRLRVNQTGIENKKFKKYQAIEAFKDPKTWMWFIYCVLVSTPNISQQQALIIKSIGYSVVQTTLLTSVLGVVQSASILIGVALVRAFKNSRGIVAVGLSLFNILGAILSLALPWSNRFGLLIAVYLNLVQAAPFAITLGWVTAATAGHTKRITVQAVVFIGYCIGNILAPQIWQAAFKPRNIVPWSIILFCYIGGSTILTCMRVHLMKQNALRNSQALSVDEDHVAKSDGLDKAFLDLTDLENMDFRYVL